MAATQPDSKFVSYCYSVLPVIHFSSIPLGGISIFLKKASVHSSTSQQQQHSAAEVHLLYGFYFYLFFFQLCLNAVQKTSAKNKTL